MRFVRHAEAFASKALGWLFARGDAAKAAHSATSDTLKIVYAYSAASSLPRAAVTDEAELPYPKPRIKAALIAAMGLATQESMRQELRNAYLRLAHWQSPPTGLSAATEAVLSARVDAEVRRLNEELTALSL